MAIQSITTNFTGEIGVSPRIIRISTDDSYSEITTQNWLQSAVNSGYQFYESDIAAVFYNDSTVSFFSLSISGSNITLVPLSSGVSLPVIANHIAVFTNTSGNLGDDVATAINGGNLQAGLSGTAGYLASFPGTAAKGSLRVTAVANTGDTLTTISNAAMGQASVISIPDPAGATANFVVAPSALVSNNLVKASGTAGLIVDAGARIVANTTAAFAGGGTTHQFAAVGLSASAKGCAVIRASTNAVSIAKALPGTDTLDITFSADPGADTTVDYIYVTAAQS
jgi:hypothetical protein